MTQAAAAMPSSGEVREFFSQLQVRREPSGKVVIEAPAEAASTLGALFEGMAALLHWRFRQPRIAEMALPRVLHVAATGCGLGRRTAC